MVYVLLLLYPIFFIVTVSLIVGGWLSRCVKKEEEQLRAIRQKPSGQARKTPSQKQTLGTQMKQAAWSTLSGIVWVLLAIVLTLAVAVLSQWQYFWPILSGSKDG